jgi:hypothetical protein
VRLGARRTAPILAVLLTVGGLTTVGCGPSETNGPPSAPDTASPEGIRAQGAVQAAIADFAERRGVEPDDVEVAAYAEVTWPDGSIGCPQPGMSYTQALVPGARLILSAGGHPGSYHSVRGGAFSYCERPKPPVPNG